MAKISGIDVPSLTWPEGSAPATPASGKVVTYAKADGLMYSKDDAGVETAMAAGAGGITQAFAGYNTVGASWETVTAARWYCKTFTLANACLLTGVDVHVRPSTDNLTGFIAAIMDDNSGSPGKLIAGPSGDNSGTGAYFSNSSSMPGTGRWFTTPMGIWLTAATYWMCFSGANTRFDVAYDSGSDKIFTASSFILTGAYPSAWTITDSTRKYSIRANTIR